MLQIRQRLIPYPLGGKRCKSLLGTRLGRASVPQVAQVRKPLYALIREGQQRDRQEQPQQAGGEARGVVTQVQVLGMDDPAPPGELDVHVTRGMAGVSWGL